jgi:alkylhydroperoxidase family enzyme
MTDFQALEQLSDAQIEERDEAIRGRPPRLTALPPEERTQRQQELLDEMSMVVVDGVRKPREDLSALEIMIRHAELYKAHLEVAKKYLSDCELNVRDRELAILRIGWLSQAPFEWGAHVKIARRNGVTSKEIEQAIVGSSSHGLEQTRSRHRAGHGGTAFRFDDQRRYMGRSAGVLQRQKTD